VKLLASLGFFILVTILSPVAVADEPEQNILPAKIVIFQVKTEGIGSDDEYILLYNQSADEVNIASWCLGYTTAGDNQSTVLDEVCVVENFIVSSGTFVSFGTEKFKLNTGFKTDFTFTAGMFPAGGHLRLFDIDKNEVDKVGWGTADNPEKVSSDIAPDRHLTDMALSRNIIATTVDTNDNFVDFSSAEVIYQCPNSMSILSSEFFVNPDGDCIQRFCPNIPTSTTEAPAGYFKPVGEVNCIEVPILLEDARIDITELYPNAPSVDAGNEFIELFNPNDFMVNLSGYSLQIGPTFSSEYIFGDVEIGPEEYASFSDTTTGIVLPNSTGVQLRLVTPAGNIVSETPIYTEAQDDQSWSLIDGEWEYTTQITPGAMNESTPKEQAGLVAGTSDTLEPCPAGKFRNPATNRCKNIESAESSLVPCDADEFRNPETNRCNKRALTGSALTPCKPGQARNPETNRCRSVAASQSELKPCEEGEERNPETNRCRKIATLSQSDVVSGSVVDIPVEVSEGQINWLIIGLAVSGTVGYMVYEWRNEFRQKIVEARQISWH
jgi:hypothetical protein